MNILKVKIPVGSDGLVKKIFLANPSGEKGVGCAGGCIKIELGKNMMDQIRSFKASMNREYPFEYSRTHLPHGKIPVDIIPGKTDPYLIVDKSGDIFWVGGVDPTKLWTPGGNTKGQYIEIKRKDGTIIYKLKKQLGQTVPPDSESKINAYVVSNSTVDKGKPLYPAVPAPTSSTYPPITGGKSKKRRTRRLKKKRKKKQTKKRKKKRRTKKRYKRRKKKSVRKRGKKKN